MSRRLILAIVGVVAVGAAVAVAALILWNGESIDDPESARCNTPDAVFGTERDQADHREVDVTFTCESARLAGTLNLPRGDGPFPAIVMVHAAGEATRWTWDVPFVRAFVREGFAVLGYDKRGVGASQGQCCPGDSGHFNLLAADADGAVHALQARRDVNRMRVGLFGISQAGWVVPLAAARAPDVAFMALVSAPAVSDGEEGLYSRLTGEEGGGEPQPKAEIARRLREEGPSGFDPAPYLQRLTIPGVWVLGGNDLSQPTDADLVVLDRLKRTGKDYTAVVIPGAGHGLLDGSGDPRAIGALVDWLEGHVLHPS